MVTEMCIKNQMTNVLIMNLTDSELLRYVDRSDPVVKELAERLELVIDNIDNINHDEKLDHASNLRRGQ